MSGQLMMLRACTESRPVAPFGFLVFEAEVERSTSKCQGLRKGSIAVLLTGPEVFNWEPELATMATELC
jgi:hypothetical protein